MKKLLVTAALLASGATQAATVAGVHLGADLWALDSAGAISTDTGSLSDFDSEKQGRAWIAVEHPVPFIPNVMLRENFLKIDGKNVNADDSTDLSHLDFTLYYELLDNDLVSLDAGAAYRKMHGNLKISGNRTDIDSGIVMAYANATASLPGFDLYGFVDVMAGINEKDVYDYSVGMGYTFDGLALDYRIRAGYREFNFEADNFSGVNANTKIDGYFLGLEIDF
ncbi:TIGR04219 family outer membrane beta-barrel protein [Parashewanella spongiae]|uniref:TIGR04219 family outer membrane beta-barrel protein n=1 Tax=Parashewanella spongiae TaxID=342950 RepID=A0A3A6TWQ5_9GAMM|nr:TIGR04219 family outer membrane beta-barrel protein [Parashewanella spongiae]MCL1078321.1 TIGR04219 family outer membrane beta-barrel protein [Parashewanella spongiae]RJY17472.1 TIGR04219 family outer membrane beta-barrel protein [Parashewanella spongiae]